jgi:hypothetical protein
MKQYIDEKQWNELTKEQADKIQGWMIGKGYHINNFNLTIGVMIEFLKDEEDKERIKRGIEYGSAYIDNCGYDYSFAEYDSTGFDLGWSGELCDELWKVVKFILEEK